MIARFALVAVLLVLAGCSTLKPAASPPGGTARNTLQTGDSWEFRGRIAVNNKVGEGDGQANLRWRQRGEISRIRISGPFGAGSAELLWTPTEVSVTDADGEQSLVYAGPDAAAAFMDDQLGWSFPANSARYWVVGLADPDAPAEEILSAEGGLAGLIQHGWVLGFQRFADVDGYVLPTRIDMETDRLKLRIVVADWNVVTDAE